MSDQRTGVQGGLTYEEVVASPAFRYVKRRTRAVVVPLLVGFLAWYFSYVIMAAFFPALMAVRLVGEINLGLVLGIGQFASTFLVTTIYDRWARGRLDPLTDRLREQLQRVGVR